MSETKERLTSILNRSPDHALVEKLCNEKDKTQREDVITNLKTYRELKAATEKLHALQQKKPEDQAAIDTLKAKIEDLETETNTTLANVKGNLFRDQTPTAEQVALIISYLEAPTTEEAHTMSFIGVQLFRTNRSPDDASQVEGQTDENKNTLSFIKEMTRLQARLSGVNEIKKNVLSGENSLLEAPVNGKPDVRLTPDNVERLTTLIITETTRGNLEGARAMVDELKREDPEGYLRLLVALAPDKTVPTTETTIGGLEEPPAAPHGLDTPATTKKAEAKAPTQEDTLRRWFETYEPDDYLPVKNHRNLFKQVVLHAPNRDEMAEQMETLRGEGDGSIPTSEERNRVMHSMSFNFKGLERVYFHVKQTETNDTFIDTLRTDMTKMPISEIEGGTMDHVHAFSNHLSTKQSSRFNQLESMADKAFEQANKGDSITETILSMIDTLRRNTQELKELGLSEADIEIINSLDLSRLDKPDKQILQQFKA